MNTSKLYSSLHIEVVWTTTIIDTQVAAYLTFASNTAGMEAALLAVTGAHDFQWMKLCNRFHRFCYQVGGAFLCGYAAFFALLLISFISAFNLFRHYSPNHFLRLKSSNNNKWKSYFAFTLFYLDVETLAYTPLWLLITSMYQLCVFNLYLQNDQVYFRTRVQFNHFLFHFLFFKFLLV